MWSKALWTIALLAGLATSASSVISAAIQVTATPARINLSTATPLPTQQLYTEIPTRTPTPVGLVILEAITEANVRAEPDPESERLGTIRAGEIYTVLGRYYRWLQFQYSPSPNGTGWVFDELVTVTGDTTNLPDLAAQNVATVDQTLLGQTETLAAITLTPGGILTATLDARIIPAPATTGERLNVETTAQPANGAALPTFTFPPDITTQDGGQNLQTTPTPVAQITSTANVANRTLPPIIPILVLGSLGLLGLIFSSMRR